MKTRYRLSRRGIRGDRFYCVDTTTGKRTSLRTTNEDDARQIVEAKNKSERQPVLNLQIAKAYLAGTDNGITTRTWQNAIEALTNTKQGANQQRWKTAAKDKAFVPLMPQDHHRNTRRTAFESAANGNGFHECLSAAVAQLLRGHELAAVAADSQTPMARRPVQRQTRHHAGGTPGIIAAEVNPERKALYQLCWHLGASQGDIANLKGEDVDWRTAP